MFIIACLLIILGLMPFLYKANHNTKDVKVNTISVERVQAPALKKKLNILHSVRSSFRKHFDFT